LKEIIIHYKYELALSVCVVLTAIMYYPSLDYDFIHSLDDDWLIVNNPAIKDFSWKGIKNIFFSDTTDFHYHPITYFSLAIDYYFFGLNPFYFKLHNLILHLLSGILIYIFIKELFKNKFLAISVSFLFLIASLNIESIVWANCRRQSLSLFYNMTSLYFFVLYINSKKYNSLLYLISFSSFVFAILAKSSAILIPIHFFCIYLYVNKENFKLKKVFIILIPFVLTCTIFIILNIFYDSNNYLKREFNYELHHHVTFIFYSIGFYFYKFICSYPQGVFYPSPSEKLDFLPSEFYFVAALGLLIFILLVFFLKKKNYGLALAIALYLISTIPMSNRIFFPFSDLPNVVNDRYFYHNGIWLILSLIILLQEYFKKRILTLFILILGISQLMYFYKYLPKWKNSISLQQHLVDYFPSEEFYYRLGIDYFKNKEFDKAVDQFNKADDLGLNIWINNHWFFYFEKSLVYLYDDNCKKLQDCISKMKERNIDKRFYNNYIYSLNKSNCIDGKYLINEKKIDTNLINYINERIVLKSSE
jgi:hypothetical protein